MHEWALAEAVVSTALKISKKEKLKEITKLRIRVGELQHIDKEILEFALKEIMRPRSSTLRNAKIEIETEEAILKCRACGHQWPYNDSKKELNEEECESIHFIPEIAHVYIRCPKCKSPDFEIIKGRGIWLNSIKGIKS